MKILFLLLFLSSDLLGFTLTTRNVIRYDSNEITVNVDSTACTNVSESANEILDLVEIAINDYWNQVPTSNLEFKLGGLINEDTTGDPPDYAAITSGSGRNTIIVGCNADLTSFAGATNGTLAVGGMQYSGTTATGGYVLINDALNGGSSNWNGLDKTGKVSTLVHEIGHAIGIGHSTDPVSIMYYSNIGKKIKLAQDDYNAITYLYPHEGPLDAGCGSIAFVGGPPDDDRHQTYMLFSFLLGLFLTFSIFGLYPSKKIE